MTIQDNETLRPGIVEVISDILVRHKDGSLSDPRGRVALAAFVTSHAPEGLLSADDLDTLDIFLDITLQLSKRAASPADAALMERVKIMSDIALGDAGALPRLQTAPA